MPTTMPAFRPQWHFDRSQPPFSSKKAKNWIKMTCRHLPQRHLQITNCTNIFAAHLLMFQLPYFFVFGWLYFRDRIPYFPPTSKRLLLTMTNRNFSKSSQGNDHSSDEQERQRQRRRIHLRQDEASDRIRRQVPTTIDIPRRGDGNVDDDPDHAIIAIHHAPTPNHPTGNAIPYRPMDISSILRLSSTMRNGSGRIMMNHAVPSTTTSATVTTTVPSMNRENFLHILDCALAICDECLEDSTLPNDESDHL